MNISENVTYVALTAVTMNNVTYVALTAVKMNNTVSWKSDAMYIGLQVPTLPIILSLLSLQKKKDNFHYHLLLDKRYNLTWRTIVS
jgi:hypothetical protein